MFELVIGWYLLSCVFLTFGVIRWKPTKDWRTAAIVIIAWPILVPVCVMLAPGRG